MGSNRFSAAAASLGYAYQFRYALWVALRRHQTGLAWSIAIEAADDLEVGGQDDDQLLQLKHRAAGTSLTDSSPDLWKTLRIWSEGIASGTLRLPDTQLLLVTTAAAAAGSACSDLAAAPQDRDNGALAERLAEVAVQIKNKSLADSTAAYLRLDDRDRASLLSAITVVDASPRLGEVDERIRSLARLMTRSDHLEPFIERLEGWWNRRSLRQLAGGADTSATGDEFDSYLTELREAFHTDNLPIDDDVADERPAVEAFLGQTFCKQLELLDIGLPRVAIAVRDFHRAFVQRSRWSHDGLLQFGELGKYERRLHEEWELHFERVRDELGAEPTDEQMLDAARRIYAWAEAADYPIRPACTEGFVSRGSLHMLADRQEVGWHPEFEMRLAAIMEAAQT